MSLARLKTLKTDGKTWKPILEKIVKRISAVESNCKVFIFGSFAEHRFTAESDLDIAVIIPDSWSEKHFLQEVYQAGPLSTWPLDLVVLKKSRFEKRKDIGGVCFDIRESGIQLFPDWNLK